METLLWISGEFLNLLSCCLFFTNIQEVKRRKVEIFFWCGVYVVVGAGVNHYLNNIIWNMATHILVGVFLLGYLSKRFSWMTIVYNMFYVSLASLSEFIAIITLQIYFKNDAALILANPIKYSLTTVIARTLLLILVKSLFTTIKIKEYLKVAIKNMLLFCCNIMAVIICLIGISYFLKKAGYIDTVIIIVIVVSLTVMNISMLYLFEEILDKERLKNEKRTYETEVINYQKRYEEVMKNYASMRSIKHDLHHFLEVLKLDVIEGETKGKILQSVEKKVEAAMPICDTGNIVLDSIVNAKSEELKKIGGRIVPGIFISGELNIEPVDLMIVLGNLLDNAIEAVAKLEDRTVELRMKAGNGNFFIEVENGFFGEIEESGGRIRTTKENKKKHGIGIENIKNVVKKYDGCMEVTHDNGIFHVKIMMYI